MANIRYCNGIFFMFYCQVERLKRSKVQNVGYIGIWTFYIVGNGDR